MGASLPPGWEGVASGARPWSGRRQRETRGSRPAPLNGFGATSAALTAGPTPACTPRPGLLQVEPRPDLMYVGKVIGWFLFPRVWVWRLAVSELCCAAGRVSLVCKFPVRAQVRVRE